MPHIEVVDRKLLNEIAKEIGSAVEENNRDYVNRFKVESTSTEGKFYVVSQRRTSGEWCCGCRGWINHHSKPGFRGCIHLNDILRKLSKATIRRDSLAAKMLESARMAYLDLSDPKPVRHINYTSTHGMVEI